MKFAQPLRETLRGRAPNLVGLCVRQDVGGYPAALLTTSLNLAGGCLTISPTGSFPFQPVVSVFHDVNVARSRMRICTMWTNEKLFPLVRDQLRTLIAKEKQVCGSTVAAAKTVARRIGASHDWVKKIVGRYGGAAIHASIYLNIQALSARADVGIQRRAMKVSDLVARMKQRRQAGLNA